LLARWEYLASAERGVDPYAADSAYGLESFYCDAGRFDEAKRFVGSVPPVARTAKFMIWSAVLRLAVEARIAAHDGRLQEASALAEEARAAIENRDADQPNSAARIWLAIGEVRREAGNPREADPARERPLESYELKENLAAAHSCSPRGV
jgi:tetratricopeptide (TPR) repeat protein